MKKVLRTKKEAVKNSIKGYEKEILVLQKLHLPFKKSHEKIGIFK